ncbi:MAG: nitroreductase family protein [Bacilli bacterium]|nr:nitroreductase family protein [Bacilli bacterium]
MEFESVIRERQSTRKFNGQSVEKEKLDNILEAGRIAPTAKNIQPIKIYVVESPEGLEKIDKASPCRYNAGTVLVVCGDKEQAFTKGEYSTYEMDACIVATHMMLEATNQGINNIWVEMFDEKVLREELSIPTEIVPVCLLPLGYKADDCPASPNHNRRKKLNELVEYI